MVLFFASQCTNTVPHLSVSQLDTSAVDDVLDVFHAQCS